MSLTQQELARRIALARERRGLSQAQLAEGLGLSQSAISRIESGERSVDSIELAAIAERLGVSVLELLEDRPVPEELLAFAGRVQAARVPGAVDRARSRVVELIQFDRLLTELGIPRESAPVGASFRSNARLAKNQGRDIAEQIRAALSVGDEPLPDLVELVEGVLGLNVAIEPLTDGVEGLCVRLPDFALALVNSTPAVGRERFTLAHELCHFLVGDAEPLHVDEDLFGQGTHEIRANAFAAHFLMPASGLRRRIRARDVDGQVVCELQYAFGVSLDALLWHLRNLGLLQAGQHDEFKLLGPKGLAFRYGYLGEWQSFYQGARRRRVPARLLRRAIEAYRKGLIGVDRLASLLGSRDPEGLQRELEEEGLAGERWPEDTAPA